MSCLSVASSYVVSKTAGLPTEQAATTEHVLALAQRNGTVNAPGFVIICSRGTRWMLRRCRRPPGSPGPSAASSAVPGWIIGNVIIDAEEWGSGRAVIKGGERGHTYTASASRWELTLPFILFRTWYLFTLRAYLPPSFEPYCANIICEWSQKNFHTKAITRVSKINFYGVIT